MFVRSGMAMVVGRSGGCPYSDLLAAAGQLPADYERLDRTLLRWGHLEGCFKRTWEVWLSLVATNPLPLIHV